MRKFFYARLALTNLNKNQKTYIPYILTCIGTISMYYIMHFISLNEGLDSMSGGRSLKILLNLGTWIIAIFSVIFLFYTNSFLIKRRKKEFGLYNILGMEKKHIARVIVWETFFVSLISLTIGLISGIVASKLMFLLLLKLLKFEVPFGFDISWNSLLATIILFIVTFIMTLINNLRQIHLVNPIQLLTGGQTGEKEPKTKWILTSIGLLCLGAGYFIALTTESPLDAMNMFFIAVILVIIGTYALFATGTIAILKLLRKNKNFYYQTKHFISVSGMIYRMKQNAIGLANICILSTAVLVMLSTTVSLYVGMEDLLRTRYPKDISVTADNVSVEASKEIDRIIKKEAENQNIAIKDPIRYRYLDILMAQENDTFKAHSGKNISADYMALLSMIPLSEYNRMENKSVTLGKDEVLIYTYRGEIKGDTLSISGNQLKIKDRLASFPLDGISSALLVNTYLIVLPDAETIEYLYQSAQGTDRPRDELSYFAAFDAEGESTSEIALANSINKKLLDVPFSAHTDGLEASKESFYSLYGGLFFLGLFLGALFIMATVLIIYYKQISEGYDDKDRYEIMQKVGLSKDEVKKSIRSQVLMVFFLPLAASVVHIAFAFKVITKLLALLNLTNVSLFAFTTVGTILIFALLYAIVYALTAREYYKIVS